MSIRMSSRLSSRRAKRRWVSLILGLLSNAADLGGALLTLVIWSTAEGFGGPYKAGSADIGTAIIYSFVFAALFLSQAGLYLGFDRRLTPMLGRWGWLAAGPVVRAMPLPLSL